MTAILDLAGTPARKGQSGPVLYDALRDPVADEHGRMQLAARKSDDERFVILLKPDATGDPVDVLNDRNVKRHALDARLREIADELDALDGLDDDASASAAQALIAEQEALTEQRSGLPRVDALRAGPVARALAMYAAEDEAGA